MTPARAGRPTRTCSPRSRRSRPARVGSGSGADPAAQRRHLARIRARPAAGWTVRLGAHCLHLTYSRATAWPQPGRRARGRRGAARRGCRPNAGYLWSGCRRRSPRSPGVRRGEQGPPAAAEDPYDHAWRLCCSTGVHIRGPADALQPNVPTGDDHLELLFGARVGTRRAGPCTGVWVRRWKPRSRCGCACFQLAGRAWFRRRLALLGEHGVDVSGATVVEQSLPARSERA